MEEINTTPEVAPAPRKRTIKPPVDEIVITKPQADVEDDGSAPLSEQTKREIEAGRRVLESFK